MKDLECPFDSKQIGFVVNTINETGTVKNKFKANSINLTNDCNEYCLTESPTGITLLYKRIHLLYKPKNDFCVYKMAE